MRSKGIKLTGDESTDMLLVSSLFQSELIASSKEVHQLSYSEFISNYLNLGITLKAEQLLVPYILYQQELSDYQRKLLVNWIINNRCNYAGLIPDRTPSSVKAKVLDSILTGDPYEFAYKPQTLVLECGRRGGKSTIACTAVVFEFLKLCMLDSPQKHYGISHATPISILVLATTAEQSKKILFRPISEMVSHTPYFQSLISRGELFIGKEEIVHYGKNIYIQMGNSNNTSLVGGTLKCLVVDEVALFDNPMDMINNLAISATPFGDDAVTILLSSAYYDKDPIQLLYESTIGSMNAVGFRLKSHDLNPGVENSPIVKRIYETNPIQAKVEFEGIRPVIANAFFSGDLVAKCMTGVSCIEVSQTQSKINNYNYTTVSINKINTPMVTGYVLHLDPAINSDSYVLAFGHAELAFDVEDTVYYIDGIVRWEPSKEYPVNFANVGAIIREINSHCPLSYVSADHYCSVETLQSLRTLSIKTESVHYSNTKQLEIANVLRTAMLSNKVSFPKDSQFIELFVTEITSLSQIGQRIDHPVGGSKDIYDAVAGVIYRLQSVNSVLAARSISIRKVLPSVNSDARVRKGSNYLRNDLSRYMSSAKRSIHDMLKSRNL